jgi:nitrile hydratase beta subunit
VNGVHDCGGMEGLGRISIEAHEPVFHAEWERRVFGLLWAAGFNGFWNLDEFRYAIERMSAEEYLGTPYYEHWLHGLETLLIEKGVVSRDALLAARHREPNIPAASNAPMTLQAVAALIASGGSAKKEIGAAPRFHAGDRVRSKNNHPHGHTRLPGYARGKAGVIERDHGIFPFNDSNAHGKENPQHVYLVRFAARELWGETASDKDSLFLDLWEEHLTPGA